MNPKSKSFNRSTKTKMIESHTGMYEQEMRVKDVEGNKVTVRTRIKTSFINVMSMSWNDGQISFTDE